MRHRCVHAQAEGFSAAIVDRFFRPFLGGIFFDTDLGTTSRLFEFVMRCLATGQNCLPARGIGAVPRQLAAQLPPGCVHTGARLPACWPRVRACASCCTPLLVCHVAMLLACVLLSIMWRPTCGQACEGVASLRGRQGNHAGLGLTNAHGTTVMQLPRRAGEQSQLWQPWHVQKISVLWPGPTAMQAISRANPVRPLCRRQGDRRVAGQRGAGGRRGGHGAARGGGRDGRAVCGGVAGGCAGGEPLQAGAGRRHVQPVL